jgi:hypothetical protein
MRQLNKDKIENFAFNIDRPFCAEEAADFCGVSLKKTQAHVKAMRDEGKIVIQRKVVNKYFYVWNGEPKQVRDNTMKTSHEFSRKADEVENTICSNGYTSLRDIAKQTGCSHEFVRQVVNERNLENVNVKLAEKKAEKLRQEQQRKLLIAEKKERKRLNQRPFLDSIVPYGARG